MFTLYTWLLLALVRLGRFIPLGVYKPIKRQKPSNSRVVVLVSAHPDDEMMSMMPLAIRNLALGFRVVNLAVTIGRPEQWNRRRDELNNACAFLGIDNIVLGENGLRSCIREGGAEGWKVAVQTLTEALRNFDIALIVTHHDNDAHPDHVASWRLVREALSRMAEVNCVVAFSEFWRDMEKPNLQVEVSMRDLGVLLKALSFHKGELSRNPYHLLWPLYLILNRQYSEILCGWGSKVASFRFSAMYWIGHWRDGQLVEYDHPKQLAASDPFWPLFPPE